MAISNGRIHEAIDLYLQRRISAQVALSRMLLGGLDAAGIVAAVLHAQPNPPTAEWGRLDALISGHTEKLRGLAAEVHKTGGDHGTVDSVASVAAFFDRAVAYSPEAAVALYSLGDKSLLDAATREIIAWLNAEALIPFDGRILDFGCGTGRVAGALAEGCREILGLDVSAGMIAEAQRRYIDKALRFEVFDGWTVPPGPFDVALLVDSMPYIFQAGLADVVMCGLASALAPQGAIVILNLSYGRDALANQVDAEQWAARFGFTLTTSCPFTLWDAAAFVFRKPTLRSR